MNTGENITVAARWIGKRPVESFLLVVGIALGIGAVSAGLNLFLHSKQEIQKLVDSTKYREIVISTREEAAEMELPAVPVDETTLAVLTSKDLEISNDLQNVLYAFIANRTEFKISSGWGGPAGMVPTQSDAPGADGPAEAGAGGRQEPGPTEALETDSPEPALDRIYGYEVTPQFFTAHGLIPASGSLITDDEVESRKPVMVLGATLAQNLFTDGRSLGREVYHRKQLYEITGILGPTGTEYDTMAFTPAVIPERVLADSQMARMFFSKNPISLHFVIDNAEQLDEVKARLESHFIDTYGEHTVTANLPREEVESTISRNRRISIIILFLAVSGLLIADVNVSNILLGRMVRSRKKIGILKAIGASKQDIFALFSLEGFLLSAAGAAVGGGVSYLLFRIMKQTLGLDGFQPGQLLIGIGIAWFITMVLTVFPAFQAAGVPAADAMRHE